MGNRRLRFRLLWPVRGKVGQDFFLRSRAVAVEQSGYEFDGAAHVVEDGKGFGGGEGGGQGFGSFGADEIVRECDDSMKDMAVEEKGGAQSLVLSEGGEVPFDGEMGDKGLDLESAHVFGMAFAVEEGVAFDLIYVGLFGTIGVTFKADGGGEYNAFT